MHTSTVHACAAAELGTSTWYLWRSSPSSLAASNLNVLDGQAGRQRLLQLVGLLEVLHAQGVQVFAAAHLELHDVLRLLDLNGCGERAGTGLSARLTQAMADGTRRSSTRRSSTSVAPRWAAPPTLLWAGPLRRAMLQHLAMIESWLSAHVCNCVRPYRSLAWTIQSREAMRPDAVARGSLARDGEPLQAARRRARGIRSEMPQSTVQLHRAVVAASMAAPCSSSSVPCDISVRLACASRRHRHSVSRAPPISA